MPLPILTGVLVISYLLADVGPVPGMQPIAPVFDKADIVCKCYVESVVVAQRSVGSVGDDKIRHQATAEVQIEDFYKSDGSRNDVITVTFEAREINGRAVIGSQRLSSGETAILFLKKGPENAYAFADPFLGVTRFDSLPQQAGEPGLLKLRSALSAVAARLRGPDTLRALQLLEGFDSFDDSSLFNVRAACNSQEPEIALTALGVLLKAQAPDGVDRLKGYLDAYKGEVATLALTAIGRELAQVTAPNDLSLVEELSGSRFFSIQLGAMEAIRKMRNPHSLPTLIKRLDEPNSAVEYISVISLAEILSKFDGDYAPSMKLFDERPQYYTNLWKQWWADEGSEIYSPR
jgi:hypothetical protein